jgi:hypothetical protein
MSKWNKEMRISNLFLLFFLTLFLVSCSGKTDTTEEMEEDYKPFPLPGQESNNWIFEGKAFGIFHEVKDFDKWKSVFDQDEPRREKAGFKFLSILRNTEDNNSIAVFFMTPNHQAAKDFIADDLRQKMDEAGVLSVPSFIMYDIVYLTNQDYSTVPYRVAVSYKVKNFKHWLEKYNEDRDNRKKAGLIDIAVARSPESHRMVYMMVASKTIEDGRTFITNESASEKLSDYGVVGDPTFSLWKRADFKE